MKKRILFLMALMLSALCAVWAQDNQTIEEFLRRRELYPKIMTQLGWQGKSERFAYSWNNFVLTAAPGQLMPDTVLHLRQLNQALLLQKTDTLRFLPVLNWLNQNSFYFHKSNAVWQYDMSRGEAAMLVEFPEKAAHHDVFGHANQWAYTIDNNLFVVKDGNHKALSKEENSGIVYGQSVHRNEFGISKGTFWSPSGSLLAFYRMDETMVEQYPLVDVDAPIAALNNIRYPMAGRVSHHVSVGVYDMNTDRQVFLQTGAPEDRYFTNISWSPDEKVLYVAELNREQNHMKLNAYNVSGGAFMRTLFEETSDKYVEPLNGMFFQPNNPQKYLWISDRNAYRHLFLYDINKGFEKQLTHGPWEVTDFLGFSDDGKMAYFVGTKESPLERHLYEVALKDGKMRKLTPDKGYNRVRMSSSKKHFIVTGSSNEVSGFARVVDAKGKNRNALIEPHNVFEGKSLPEVKLFTLKAKDGTDLHCRQINPVNMDAGKKYPVMVYVYGGPHAQMVTDSWLGGANLFFIHMAMKGYVIFTLDNRGSAARGREFEQAIHRNLGKVEVEDQIRGVDYLKTLDYVDASRIGVYGWSYGGFMATRLMLEHPDVFKVGVAGGPVMDWKYYEVMYGERYMGTPENNPEGYKNASLLNKADKLKGRLLLIHGDNDDVVVMQHNLAFIKKCVQAGTMPDLMIYPGHGHNVGGRDRTHLFKIIERYFNDFL